MGLRGAAQEKERAPVFKLYEALQIRGVSDLLIGDFCRDCSVKGDRICTIHSHVAVILA